MPIKKILKKNQEKIELKYRNYITKPVNLFQDYSK